MNLPELKQELQNKAADAILDRLRHFLSPQLVTELSLAYAIRPSITICCTVDYIIKNYNSTEGNEADVSSLLEKLLNLHFKPKAK